MIALAFRKREVFIALALGAAIAVGLNIWFDAVAKPEAIDDYLWLARLQEPGAQVGERLASSLYPAIQYWTDGSVSVQGSFTLSQPNEFSRVRGE